MCEGKCEEEGREGLFMAVLGNRADQPLGQEGEGNCPQESAPSQRRSDWRASQLGVPGGKRGKLSQQCASANHTAGEDVSLRSQMTPACQPAASHTGTCHRTTSRGEMRGVAAIARCVCPIPPNFSRDIPSLRSLRSCCFAPHCHHLDG